MCILNFILQPVFDHCNIHVNSWNSAKTAIPVAMKQSNQFLVDNQRTSTIQVARSSIWVVKVTSAKISVGDDDIVFQVFLNTKIMVYQWDIYPFKPPYWVPKNLKKMLFYFP